LNLEKGQPKKKKNLARFIFGIVDDDRIALFFWGDL